MNSMNGPIIAILTDFGLDDFFVPSLKGVIASINPSASVIDVTHNVPSFDIKTGGFMKSIKASDAKKRLLELIREADESFERYCITRNGEPKAVLMSVDDYEGWLETLEILSDKEAVAEIKKARRELDQGKGIHFEKVLEKIRG